MSGSAEQIQVAKEEIQKILGESSVSVGVVKDISIPRELHCAVIGKGGENVQKIRQASGVTAISIPPQGSNSEIISIKGSNQVQVNKAVELIHKFVASHEQKTLETDALYQKYQSKTQIHADNRSRYFEQASEAYKRGDKALASELSKKGKLEQYKMLKSMNHAALGVFKAK